MAILSTLRISCLCLSPSALPSRPSHSNLPIIPRFLFISPLLSIFIFFFSGKALLITLVQAHHFWKDPHYLYVVENKNVFLDITII